MKKGILLAAFLGITMVLSTTPLLAEQTKIEQQKITDGVYSSESFTWSGGSGRLEITCDQVEIKDGEVLAEITFSSEHIVYVKVDGKQYDPVDQGHKKSVYMLPVDLGEDTDITACTTAMSTPHEVDYVLTFGDGVDSYEAKEEELTEIETEDTRKQNDLVDADSKVADLTLTGETTFDYADQVRIFHYDGGYRLIAVNNSEERYLVVPENQHVPESLPEDVTVLQQPLDHIYVAATASMALINAVDALDQVSYSSLQENDWYVDAAAKAMQDGKITYAGKYSEPDYEMLLSGGCDLAVESTMILHSPQVKEMLEGLGIPVWVDRASYEAHPLGRTEWVKVYGTLLGKEDESDTFFAKQKQVVEDLGDVKPTGKKVAFFYVDSKGSVVVRRSDDYIPKMITMAGGVYALSDLQAVEESTTSSVSLTMEQFYHDAVDADYLVYNSTIDEPLTSLDDLYDKSTLFKEFKAVQNGQVWCTDKYLYQATDIVGELIRDFYGLLNGGKAEEMTFLRHVE